MKREIFRMDNVIVESENIVDLYNINFHIFQGEIMGLISVDSQGKEKLFTLMCKNVPIKYGNIYFSEKLVNSYQSSDGSNNKVYVIDQTSKLVNDLTVADNVFVLKKGFKKYFINPKVLNQQLLDLQKKYKLEIDPDVICKNLSVFERCTVELLKAVIQGSKMIVVNDLSNILSAKELENLKVLLKIVARKGISIVYVGNHHEEVFPFCDRVILMKDGKIIKIFDKIELKETNVLPFIISFEDKYNNVSRDSFTEYILFKNFETTYLKKVTFSVGYNECLVIYDRNNIIPSDLTEAFLIGDNIKSGSIALNHKVYQAKNVKKMLDKEIAIIGDNPLHSMLFYDLSYIDNLSFSLDKKACKGSISRKVKKSIFLEYEKELGNNLYAKDLYHLDTKALYDLIYYRILLLKPNLVFIIQPFSNADMYMRRHIIQLIRSLKQKGIAVVILAVSLSDSLYVADRLLIVENGSIINEAGPDNFSQIRLAIES